MRRPTVSNSALAAFTEAKVPIALLEGVIERGETVRLVSSNEIGWGQACISALPLVG